MGVRLTQGWAIVSGAVVRAIVDARFHVRLQSGVSVRRTLSKHLATASGGATAVLGRAEEKSE